MELPEPFQHERDMVMMFGLILGVHKDNMNVDDDKGVEVLPEYLIHKALEYKGGWPGHMT